jgi:hypothetical protein
MVELDELENRARPVTERPLEAAPASAR